MWSDSKLVDVEIDDNNTGIYHVFEMQRGMNEFDHRIFFLLLFTTQNGFWFSIGFCLLFFIPAIIFNVKLAKHYRRMTYERDMEHGYDA